MNKHYLAILIGILLVIGTFPATAQVFPVTIATQSVPPHTGNLADMVAPGLERLGATLILNDRNELSYQVRLKVEISGQGITLTTKESLVPNPITLSYGTPTQLSGIELSEYLDINNLDFSGFSREEYLSEGRLPEGFYSVCFTVFDYDRSNESPVSLVGCTSMNVILHDPPVILSPIGQQLATNPQNLGVQWQERHAGGFPVEYTLQIFEFDPNSSLTPDLIFEFEQPYVEQVITMATSSLITAADPQLNMGSQYLMRVRASDLTMQNAFYNDGWSAPEYFTFGEACAFPQGISAQAVNETQAAVSWQPLAGFNSYLIRYREYGRTDANWYEDETLNINHTLSDLTDGTTYEYQIQTLCNGTSAGPFSPVDTFSTPAIEFDATEFDCTDEFTLPQPTNTTPIESLEFGSVVDLGGFEFRITQADQNADDPDSWDGTGLVIVPWLGLRIISTFEGLYVNELNEVYDGEVVALEDGWGQLTDIMTPEEVEEEQADDPEPTLCGEVYVPFGGGDEEEEEEEAEEEEAEEEEEEADELDTDALLAHLGGVFLPVTLGEDPNMIVIESMSFGPTGASLNAFMSADIPMADRHVAFTTTTNFHPGGLLGESNLVLANDQVIEITDKIIMTIAGGDDSYVAWNCEGVSAIGMAGEIAFCRDLIVPVDTDTWERQDEGFVTASFLTNMPSWGEFVAEVSMSPFELPDLQDWAWTVESAVFDFSDSTTPESVVFPEDYGHPDVESEEGADSPLWTGFYLSALNIKLPESFNDGDDPIEVAATNIIIDYTGFTGTVSATNLLSLDQGRVGSWAFAIDSLEIGVISNQFEHAALAGEVEVPALDDPLAYGCLIQPSQGYFFSIALTEDVGMSAWQAQLELYADTEISLEYLTEEREFTASAVLHGMASMNSSVGSNKSADAPDKLVIPSVAFQDFELSTAAPYLITIGSWQLAGEEGEPISLAGFPVNINELSLTQEEEIVTLLINAEINLMNDNDGGFAAGGQVRLMCGIEINDAGRQVWNFEGVEVDELFLDVSGPGYSLYGSILFYEDTPDYGSGFRAAIEASFDPSLTVEAIVQFGEVDDYRYWFADAMASFNPGIQIGTTGLALYGFGGGASYHMTRAGMDDVELEEGEEEDPEEAESDIGMSLSGVQYIPDESAGIGIRARLGIGLSARETFNADVMFEIIFNANGGLSQIAFEGDARFLTPPAEEDPAIRAILAMNYDFENDAFHAQLDMYINIAGGVVSGAYDDNLAGTGIIHADPSLWYIHLGTPDNRIMLSYDLGPLADLAGTSPDDDVEGADGAQIDWGNMGLLLTAYLDAGMNLPAFPALPPEVTDILGEITVINPDDPRFQGGSGLMFGASMQLTVPDISFLAFYAEFSAGAGFDVMMLNLGEAARCAGNETSSEPIGINGWYATGQVWGYVEGAIGLHVDIFGVSGDFEILSLAAAAVLAAQLPNPMWMKGIVGGRYSILGGLVKGRCRFEFELGEKCEIVGASPLAGIELIGSTQPNENDTEDVDVFSRPQVTFNLPIGDIFELRDDEGNLTQYRPSLYEFDITNVATSEVVTGTINWNDNNDVVVLTPYDILTGYTEYSFSVRVRFEKRPEGSSSWSVLLDENNTPLEQTAEFSFTTGGAPDYIPHHNIAYSYPVIDQFNFLKSESGNGYLQLKQGQPYLFKSEASFALDAADWNQELVFYQNNGEASAGSFSYNNSTRRVAFSIPSSSLANNTVSQIALMNKPVVASSDEVDENVAELEQELLSYQNDESDGEYTTIVVEAKVAESQLTDLKEKDFYSAHFRTSLYNTFNEKMDALDFSSNWFLPLFINEGSSVTIDRFGVYAAGNEYFDEFDQEGYFNGDEDIPSLIQLEANTDITADNWFNNTVGDIMYDHFPQEPGMVLSWRDTDILGETPTRAVTLEQNATPHRLTEDDKLNGTAAVPLPQTGVVYDLPINIIRDYFEYAQDAADYIVDNSVVPDEIIELDEWSFIYPDFGDYGVQVRYILPGTTTPSTERQLIIPYGTNN
ncbi:MAG: fibronectin type III domain-containing protein [Bacteroidota bacterium]